MKKQEEHAILIVWVSGKRENEVLKSPRAAVEYLGITPWYLNKLLATGEVLHHAKGECCIDTVLMEKEVQSTRVISSGLLDKRNTMLSRRFQREPKEMP